MAEFSYIVDLAHANNAPTLFALSNSAGSSNRILLANILYKTLNFMTVY